MTDVPLAEALVAALASVPGSPERSEILRIMGRARRLHMDAAAATAVASTLKHVPGSIRRNLGRIALETPVWIEYPHAPRLGAFGVERDGAPERVGALLAVAPGDGSHLVAFVAWRTTTGVVHHAYALLHWDMAELAWLADQPESGDEAERIASAVTADVPAGLREEMLIWQSLRPEGGDAVQKALAQTRRDAVGEAAFLLGALVLLASDAARLEPGTGGEAVRLSPSPPPRWPFRPEVGFRTAPLSDRLLWTDPASTAVPAGAQGVAV